MRTILILHLSFLSLTAPGQKTLHWSDLVFVEIKNPVKTTFDLLPIDSAAFEAAKQRGTKLGATDEFSVVPSDSGIYISNQITNLFLPERLNVNSSLDHVAYIAPAKTHLINWKQENTITNCLVELPSGNVLIISRDFDQGILGMNLSMSEEYLLVYSSYDDPSYDYYYDYRSEFRIYRISRSGLKNWVLQADFTSEQWSIADAVWVDSQTIALKTYLGTNSATNLENGYKYFQINITDDLEDCQPK